MWRVRPKGERPDLQRICNSVCAASGVAMLAVEIDDQVDMWGARLRYDFLRGTPLCNYRIEAHAGVPRISSPLLAHWVIAHEVGHMKLGHCEEITRGITNERRHQCEIEADAFAVDTMLSLGFTPEEVERTIGQFLALFGTKHAPDSEHPSMNRRVNEMLYHLYRRCQE